MIQEYLLRMRNVYLRRKEMAAHIETIPSENGQVTIQAPIVKILLKHCIWKVFQRLKSRIYYRKVCAEQIPGILTCTN